MTKIETNASLVATAYTSTSAQVAAPGFSGAMDEAQGLPRSAYVPSVEPCDRDKHGSHRVGGVELVPGAPGYDFDRALPWLKEIAATDRQLASYLSSKGIQVGPAMPQTLPVAVEPVVIADPALQAALDEIENAVAAQTPTAVPEETASLVSSDETATAAIELPDTVAISEAEATETVAQAALPTRPETLLITSQQYLSQHMEMKLASSLMDSVEEDDTQTA